MKENKTLYTLALIALLTVSAYFLADTVDAMIGRSLDAAPKFTTPLERDRPVLEPRRELSDYTSILERGLFGEGKGPSSGPAVESTNYKLIGTIEGESFSGAVLEDSTGQAFYRMHQKLPDGSQIVKVKRDKVTLQRPDGSKVDIVLVDEDKIVNGTNSQQRPREEGLRQQVHGGPAGNARKHREHEPDPDASAGPALHGAGEDRGVPDQRDHPEQYL